MDDNDIIELFWKRNELALSETAVKYGNYCYKIAYNILANSEDADESVNDTYLGAWNSIPPYRPTVLATFIGKITRRVALKKWRDKSTQKRGNGEIPLVIDELSNLIPATSNVEDIMQAEELSKIINAFVVGLPPAERRVFVCRYWYIDTITDISKQFGFSKSKVKSMLYRTREKLLIHLRMEGVYDDN